MPRVRVRKTDRGLIQPDIYERAFLDISVRNISLRAAAKSHGICHVTFVQILQEEGRDQKGEDQTTRVQITFQSLLCGPREEAAGLY